MIKCEICNKEYSEKGIGTHIWRNHTEEGIKFDPNKKIKNGEITQWNKGKTFEELYSKEKIDEIKKKIGDKIRGGIRKSISDESRLKMSKSAKKRGLGGYVKGGGRGIHGLYKGIWCDSTWELAWVIYQIEHNIEFVRNKEGFEYEYENKKFKYYPDFILCNTTYVEIKGWLSDKDKEKIKQFKGKLIVLEETDMNYIFEYVKTKYGNNFKNLYESNTNQKKCDCGNVKYRNSKMCRKCWCKKE